jgi:hypothetical protein
VSIFIIEPYFAQFYIKRIRRQVSHITTEAYINMVNILLQNLIKLKYIKSTLRRPSDNYVILKWEFGGKDADTKHSIRE